MPNTTCHIMDVIKTTTDLVNIIVVHCAFWYHLCNLKNMKTLISCNFTKSNTHPWVFSCFLNCRNDTKSRNASHIDYLDYWLFDEMGSSASYILILNRLSIHYVGKIFQKTNISLSLDTHMHASFLENFVYVLNK